MMRGSQVIYNSSLQFAIQVPNGAGVGNQQFQNGVMVGGTPLTWPGGSSSLSVQWVGGRTMVSIDCDGAFPSSSLNLQVQMLNQRANWIQVGSGVIPVGPTAAGMWAIDTAPGQYRLSQNSGITVAMNVLFTGVTYE